MDRRDEELLARQLRGINPPRGNLVGVAVAVLLVGLMVGGMVFAPQAHEPPTAARNMAALSVSSQLR